MKLLVSSSALAKLLSKIPKNEYVERVNLEDGELILIAQTKTVKMPVHIMKFEASLKQDHRRWDWLHDLVSKVNEQPITLEIKEGVVNVIFQY